MCLLSSGKEHPPEVQCIPKPVLRKARTADGPRPQRPSEPSAPAASQELGADESAANGGPFAVRQRLGDAPPALGRQKNICRRAALPLSLPP